MSSDSASCLQRRKMFINQKAVTSPEDNKKNRVDLTCRKLAENYGTSCGSAHEWDSTPICLTGVQIPNLTKLAFDCTKTSLLKQKTQTMPKPHKPKSPVNCELTTPTRSPIRRNDPHYPTTAVFRVRFRKVCDTASRGRCGRSCCGGRWWGWCPWGCLCITSCGVCA